MQKKVNKKNNSSLWLKIKEFITDIFIAKPQEDESDNGDSSSHDSSGSSGSGGEKAQGTGFIDLKAATHVRDPETILYNELKSDPAAMAALKKLTNGQIPSSEVAAEFSKVRNSAVALEAIANSEFAPSDIKAKARQELEQQKRNKLQAEAGFKKPPPRPSRF